METRLAAPEAQPQKSLSDAAAEFSNADQALAVVNKKLEALHAQVEQVGAEKADKERARADALRALQGAVSTA